jgi:hypothetical protein
MNGEGGGPKKKERKALVLKVDGIAPVIKEVTLADISFDESVITRSEINEKAVEEYAEKYARQIAGDLAFNETEFPLPDVFMDAEGRFWIANGIHRVSALIRIGETTWKCNVHLGERAAAIEFAASSDREVGVRRTHADKRAAVVCVLAQPSLRTKSNVQIAAICGVDEKLVRQERDRLYPEEKGQPRMGEDNKMRRPPKRKPATATPASKEAAPATPPPATPPMKALATAPSAERAETFATVSDPGTEGTTAANDTTSDEPRFDAGATTPTVTQPTDAGAETPSVAIPHEPEVPKTTFGASNGSSVSLFVVPATSSKRSSIVITGTTQADLDNVVSVIDRAKNLGMDLTASKGDALLLLMLGLDQCEREDKAQKDLFAEAMGDVATPDAPLG